MTEIKEKLGNANRFVVKYALGFEVARWILIIGFFSAIITQREKLLNNQNKMMYNDSLRGLKQDSALVNVKKLETTLNKIK